jgi:hypothetical protein
MPLRAYLVQLIRMAQADKALHGALADDGFTKTVQSLWRICLYRILWGALKIIGLGTLIA